MSTWTPTAPHQERARLLLVDTDEAVLDGVGISLQANHSVDVVATVRSIDDAHECAAKYSPDVIVIGWSKSSSALVHGLVGTLRSPLPNPLIVIVLPGDITSIPGLRSVCLMPNVALVVHAQLENLLRRHALQTLSVQTH